MENYWLFLAWRITVTAEIWTDRMQYKNSYRTADFATLSVCPNKVPKETCPGKLGRFVWQLYVG